MAFSHVKYNVSVCVQYIICLMVRSNVEYIGVVCLKDRVHLLLHVLVSLTSFLIKLRYNLVSSF